MNKESVSFEDIKEAIANEEFVLYFHQIIGKEGIVGAEALARWDSKKFKKIISPSVFIDTINEDFELSTSFSSLMYANFLLNVQDIVDNGFVGYLSFNLSATDLSPESNFSTTVINTTPKDLIKHIQLEVTSQHPIKKEHHELSANRVLSLKENGFRIAIDNMGSARGFNVFDLLSEYVSAIKIDKSFADTMSDKNGNELERPVAAIKGLIAAVEDRSTCDMEYVLEGVESGERGDSQMQILNREGLGYLNIQGYIGGIPLPVMEFIKKFC